MKGTTRIFTGHCPECLESEIEFNPSFLFFEITLSVLRLQEDGRTSVLYSEKVRLNTQMK